MNKPPYVVSGDIHWLIREWTEKSNLKTPGEPFFCDLRNNFCGYMRSIFTDLEFISENEIAKKLNRLLSFNELPIISLEPIYCKSNLNIGTTRAVDENLLDIGVRERSGSPAITKQFYKILRSGVKKAALVDDVIFSGGGMIEICNKFSAIGITIPIIFAGIGIGDGVRKLRKLGIEVKCCRYFEEVIDEVCERDFYPGVPLSGRQLMSNHENVGIPYLLPFGNPFGWASIPEKFHQEFSIFCLDQTIRLFQEIENVSRKAINCHDLERKIFKLPTNGIRLIDALEEAKKSI